jgi:hypothetical protein
MTKKSIFVAAKSRVFATLATAGVMVGGVAGLEAQAVGEANAELTRGVVATDAAKQAASIDRFGHPAPAAAAIAAPTATSTGSSTRATTQGTPAAPATTTPAAPTTPAPPAPSTGGTNGTSGGSR